MNAHLLKKTSLLVCLGASPMLSACAGSFSPQTDPVSPIAPQVQALVDANRRYPRWRDFPAPPSGLPQATAVASRVAELQNQGGALAGEASRIDWTLGDAEAQAAEVRARVEATPVSPDALRTQAEIDAFARSLRDRAKAPPPVDRRPVE